MNRRSFLQFLGIGAATAAVAPKILAEQTPEYYPEADYPITLDMLQTAYAGTVYQRQEADFINPGAGHYMFVRLAPTSLPVSVGDIVYYKKDRRWGTIAYKRSKLTLSQPMGIGIGALNPGNYGFIQLSNVGPTIISGYPAKGQLA